MSATSKGNRRRWRAWLAEAKRGRFHRDRRPRKKKEPQSQWGGGKS
jgi:hypothetical protein